MAGFMAADKSYFYTKTRRFWAKRYQFSPQSACSFPAKACKLPHKSNAFGQKNVEEKIEWEGLRL